MACIKISLTVVKGSLTESTFNFDGEEVQLDECFGDFTIGHTDELRWQLRGANGTEVRIDIEGAIPSVTGDALPNGESIGHIELTVDGSCSA